MFAENQPNIEHLEQVMAYVSQQTWYDETVKTAVERFYNASGEDLSKDLVSYAKTLSGAFRTLAACCCAASKLRTLAADSSTSNLFDGSCSFALQSMELNLRAIIKTDLVSALKLDNDDGYAHYEFRSIQSRLLLWVESILIAFFNKVVTDGSVTNVQYYTLNTILCDLHNRCFLADAN